MPAWLVWLILAGVLAAGETASGSFVLLMMSGGALGGAVTAAAGGGLLLQVIVAIVLTVGLVWLVRPIALRHAYPGPPAITGSDALVGREALVLSEVTRDGGLVRLNGAEWTARSKDPGQVIAPGARVSVVGIDGATAVVWQDPFYLEP
jgi:membrane protein implicated in regulation of membrane protease activity